MTIPHNVFSVQDETGTVYQLTVSGSPSLIISVGDTGNFTGTPDDGTDGFAPPSPVTAPFTVTQVLNSEQFSINTKIQSLADWPRSGVVTWVTGLNANTSTSIDHIDGANAYMTVAEYLAYWLSRGTDFSSQSTTAIQGAIVQATDYLDQKYKFTGTKLVQQVGSAPIDANAAFLMPWLYPGLITNALNNLTPATSKQSTEWPRQGVVNLDGLTVNGIPPAIKQACAQLASRIMQGTALQPDFDSNVVTNGAVVESISQEVGPIKTTTTYDTKIGLGFFPSFPQVTRILRSAGLLSSQGRRTVMR